MVSVHSTVESRSHVLQLHGNRLILYLPLTNSKNGFFESLVLVHAHLKRVSLLYQYHVPTTCLPTAPLAPTEGLPSAMAIVKVS